MKRLKRLKRRLIKRSRQGAFTAWAKRHHYSMATAIRKGLHARSAHVRQMANFARNFGRISRRRARARRH